MAKQPDIELVSLTKRYGETVAVDSIGLRIPSGSYCCLLGPSGCGKTTVLKMLAGFEAPTSGQILMGGRPVTGRYNSALYRGVVSSVGRAADF